MAVYSKQQAEPLVMAIGLDQVNSVQSFYTNFPTGVTKNAVNRPSFKLQGSFCTFKNLTFLETEDFSQINHLKVTRD